MDAGLDTLYQLLPAVYRSRDAGIGYPLRDFLRVLETQAQVIDADIARLYDNWFIETCDDWVVPYIGDLLGYSLLPEAATLGEGGSGQRRLGRVLAPRRDVANTIGARRRKGTLALLEDLARSASDWPARAVEFYRLLGWMQHLDHRHSQRGRTADLRRPGALDLVGAAFDPLAHTLDVRRLASHQSRGRYSIPAVGLFVFRLRSYTVTKTPANCLEERGPHCFTFSVLGNDTPLYQRPIGEAQPTHIAEEENLPVPLRAYRFALRGNDAKYRHASSDLYGPDKSVNVYAPDWPVKGQGNPLPRERVIPANLSEWRYHVPRDHVAIDVERGRMMFPAEQRPKRGVWVDYSYGFAADIGGGEYARPVVELDGAVRYTVHTEMPEGAPSAASLPPRHFASIADALQAWTRAKDDAVTQAVADYLAAGLSPDEAAAKAKLERPRALIIELAESGIYEGRLDLQLEAGEAIQLRAADRTRPILRLLDYRASQADGISVSGRRGSRLVLDGLMVIGRGIDVQPSPGDDASPGDELCELVVRHCTLVPGWNLHCDCDPRRPGEPSITLSGVHASVRVEHSIIGAIAVIGGSGEPPVLSLCDSIVDATDAQRIAIGAPDEAVAYADAHIQRCTVIGEVQVHTISEAQDSIFVGRVRVLRRQHGCMRFCYAPQGSRTPRRFHCQPDLALEAAGSDAALRASERLRVVPMFMRLRYGTPDYARLADECCVELRTGASDESAMGAFHDLYEPQRAANLAARLEEFSPAGADAGIIFAS
jgi:hypothetical protein